MNAKRVSAASGVICAAQKTRQTPAGIAAALEAAGLLQSPESAAELVALRKEIARLTTQSARVKTAELQPGDRLWHPYDMAQFTVSSVPEKLKVDLRFHTPGSTAGSESGMRVTGTDDSGELVYVDAAQSYLWTRGDAAAELDRLRARVAELEALTPATIQTCQSCGAGYTYGEPCSVCEYTKWVAAERAAVDRSITGQFPATAADRWNALYPVGSPVTAYPGCRPEDDSKCTRLVTRTRSAASVLGGHTAVVWVEGHGACIKLTHVDPQSGGAL